MVEGQMSSQHAVTLLPWEEGTCPGSAIESLEAAVRANIQTNSHVDATMPVPHPHQLLQSQSHPTLGRRWGGGDKGKTEERVVDENTTIGMSVKLCFKIYLILSDQSNLHSYSLQRRGNPWGRWFWLEPWACQGQAVVRHVRLFNVCVWYCSATCTVVPLILFY